MLQQGRKAERWAEIWEGRMRAEQPEMGQDAWVQCRSSRLEEPPSEVGMGRERLN